MPKKTAKKSPKKLSTPKAGGSASSLNPQKALDALTKEANALPAASVKVSHLSASVARTNVDAAMKALAPYIAKIGKLAPGVDAKKVTSLASIARAYELAVTLVPSERSDHTIDGALARVTPIRAAALSFLEAAAFCGIVDAGQVRSIRQGHGKRDVALDAVAIATIFDQQEAALAGKHPFTDTQLDTLRDEGTWLTEHLKAGGTIKDPKSRSSQATLRDRIAMLLEAAYAEAENLAAAIWGFSNVREHLPALYAQAAAPKKKAAKPIPAPPPSTMPS